MTRAVTPSRPVFFRSASEWRGWLGKNHTRATELLVAFHRKAPGSSALTYPEALDEALCFGWIDGVRRSLGDGRWTIRFSPRKPGSIWSLVNLRHVARLKKAGRMAAPGLRVFESRDRKRSGLYSFEQRKAAKLDRASARAFRAHPKAWTFFQSQPPGYRKVATFWVTSARKPETRARRLARLIDDSAHGRRLVLLSRPAGKKP